jgi:surfactin synthase thioesterase subunit
VLTGDYDPSTTLDEADAWRVHTTDALPLKSYPGGHLYLSKHQSAVNNELAQEIADLTVPEPA